MIRSVLIAGCLSIAVAAPALAQAQAQTPANPPADAHKRFEISALGGYTFSSGITGEQSYVTPVGTFNGIRVDSAPSFGASFGVLTKNGGEVGFMWNRQLSTLGVKGVPTIDIGDLNIDNYHAYFAYNAMEGAKTRPYFFIGLGATHYGSVAYVTSAQSGEIPSAIRFSFKLGLGIKSWASDSVGFRAGMQWTPTYISSQDTGWWCDPFWGCYMTSVSKVSHQFELSGGIVFRFGGN